MQRSHPLCMPITRLCWEGTTWNKKLLILYRSLSQIKRVGFCWWLIWQSNVELVKDGNSAPGHWKIMQWVRNLHEVSLNNHSPGVYILARLHLELPKVFVRGMWKLCVQTTPEKYHGDGGGAAGPDAARYVRLYWAVFQERCCIQLIRLWSRSLHMLKCKKCAYGCLQNSCLNNVYLWQYSCLVSYGWELFLDVWLYTEWCFLCWDASSTGVVYRSSLNGSRAHQCSLIVGAGLSVWDQLSWLCLAILQKTPLVETLASLRCPVPGHWMLKEMTWISCGG